MRVPAVVVDRRCSDAANTTKRVEIRIGAPRRIIGDELACPLDSVMLRAPRAKPEAAGMEMRFEDRREHLRNGLADQPIHRRMRRHDPFPGRPDRDWSAAATARDVGRGQP
jgi:hypothetical protein